MDQRQKEKRSQTFPWIKGTNPILVRLERAAWKLGFGKSSSPYPPRSKPLTRREQARIYALLREDEAMMPEE
jgi:hypothetical protein